MPVCGAFCSETETLHKAAHILTTKDNACHSVSTIRFSAELRQNDRRYNLEATNNIYLPGGRRVRGFVGIEPLVHPCP